MPGENCSVVGCGSCRRHNIGIFKLPKAINEFNKKWRSDILAFISKGRDLERDQSFRNQLKADTVYICEKHFRPEDIDQFEKRKKLIRGAVPSLLGPIKSHESVKQTPRRELTIVRDHVPSLVDKPNYKSFDELLIRVKGLKLGAWKCIVADDKLVLELQDVVYLQPKFQVIINTEFLFSITFFGWFLPDDHEIYKNCQGSVQQITVSNLLRSIEGYEICKGTNTNHLALDIIPHVYPKSTLLLDNTARKYPYPHDFVVRSTKCRIFTSDGQCKVCQAVEQKESLSKKRKETKLLEPAKLKSPLSATHPDRLKLALRQERLKCAQLEMSLKEITDEICAGSVEVSPQLGNDLTDLMSKVEEMPPFMKIFWQQQQKAIKSDSRGIRYHPQIIKFCLCLAAKSASSYDELRVANILTLPSRRTLRDYKNYVKPHPGFNCAVLDELSDLVRDYTEHQRYVVVLMDEMKIKSNLVFEESSNELIGYVDLGDTALSYSTLEKVDTLASQVLAIFVRGLCTNLRFNMAYFATAGVKFSQLLSIFWKAVGFLESRCNLYVTAAVCDGAPINRRFIKVHGQFGNNEKMNVTYRCQNFFAPTRYVYFISDAPHLLKTARNCLHHSAQKNSARIMWKDGKWILWQHITSLVQEDMKHGLHLLPKISSDHINLTPYSLMNVKLAVQVLSNTMASVLENFGPPEASETALFCKNMNKFFDCVNVRSVHEAVHRRNNYLSPYKTQDDFRFKWLTEDFLGYFSSWKESIEEREGTFTERQKQAMFISPQTYEGLKITVSSMIEVTQFLLERGYEYVLTERLCQDPVEEYFGNQRQLGRASDNPDIRAFGYNDNTIRVRRSIHQTSGNASGSYTTREDKWKTVNNTPLNKRKTMKKL